MYIYVKAKGEQIYTVGFYDPKGEWVPESDHDTAQDAAIRVAYLNGTKVKEV